MVRGHCGTLHLAFVTCNNFGINAYSYIQHAAVIDVWMYDREFIIILLLW